MTTHSPAETGVEASSARAFGESAAQRLAEEEVVQFTSELIRIDTSNRGSNDCLERPAAEYVAEKLAEVGIETTILEASKGRSNVVARIEGSDSSRPGLLLHGHLDVVPAVADEWTFDPFSGEIHEGEIWGRGAVDMKDMDAMILSVVRSWARDGRKPVRDIVLTFTADEEGSMEYGSEWLAAEHPHLFDGCTEGVSEIGGHQFNAGPGSRVYPVAAAERGLGWIRLEARGRAGHGALPNDENAVVRLAQAMARIDAYKWPIHVSSTTRAALEQLAVIVGTDLDPDDPALNPTLLRQKLGLYAPIVETALTNSATPTMMQAGYAENVIPSVAVGYVDGRLIPGGEEEFKTTMNELIGPDVSWEFSLYQAPIQSPIDVPTFAAMREAILAEDPQGHVVPGCTFGGTDGKMFAPLGINNYGFVPLSLPADYEFEKMFHGVDERVPVDALRFGVRVLDRFLSTVQ